jgi:hypothetical protein
MILESKLGDKGLYFSGCIDQKHLKDILKINNSLTKEENIHFNLSIFRYLDNKDLYEYVELVFHNAITEYLNQSQKSILDYLAFDGYKINSWKTGVSLPPHVDSIQYGVHKQSLGPRPTINVLAYLTDDYEEGEMFFPKLDISIKPKAGSVVIFDSDLIHAVNAVKSGDRITMSSNIYSIYSEDIEEFKSNSHKQP